MSINILIAFRYYDIIISLMKNIMILNKKLEIDKNTINFLFDKKF